MSGPHQCLSVKLISMACEVDQAACSIAGAGAGAGAMCAERVDVYGGVECLSLAQSKVEGFLGILGFSVWLEMERESYFSL